MQVVDRVGGVLRDVVGIEPPAADVDLVDAGLLDSLMVIMLVAELEQAFSVTVPIDGLNPEDVRSVARLAALVQRLLDGSSSDSTTPKSDVLVPIRAGSSHEPIFLVPGATGTLVSVGPLVEALSTSRSLYGLTPGRLADDDQSPTVEDFADAYATAIRSVSGRDTCTLIGTSFGGLIAYEVARRLRDDGVMVEHVVLIDSRLAPGCMAADAQRRYHASLPLRKVRYVLLDPRRGFPTVARTLLMKAGIAISGRDRSGRELPAGERWQRIAVRATNSYRPGPYDGDVTLLLTRDWEFQKFNPSSVWARSVGGAFSVRYIPGHHLNFLQQPRAGRVAAAVERALWNT